LKDILIYLR